MAAIVLIIAFLVGAVGVLTVAGGYRHNGEEGEHDKSV